MNQDKRSGYTSLLVKQIDNSSQTPHQLEPISNLPTLTLKLYPTILKFSFVSMITVGVILSSLILPSKLAAIPAFARKHGKPCQTCHVSEPKLNAFGELFRANGYQLPGTIEDTPPWSMRQIVMAAMLHEMAVDRIIESNMRAVPPPGLPSGGEYHVRSFRNAGGHIWLGGTFGKNLSFMTSLGVEQEFSVKSGRFSSESHAHWDFAFFQYNNIFNSGTGMANIKFGSFELELPYSELRRLSSALAPYEVYRIKGVKGSFRLDAPQVGVSFNGLKMFGVNSLRYEVAVVNGTNGNFDTNVEFDYYTRLAYSRLFDGMIKQFRIGGLYYMGAQNLRDLSGNPYPTADILAYWDELDNINVHVNQDLSKFYRWGIDVTLDLELLGFPINLYSQYLVGHDDDIDMTNLNMPYFGAGDSGGGHGDHQKSLSEDPVWLVRPFDYSGGFIGTDIVVIPTSLYLIARYDWVDLKNQWADPVNGNEVRADQSASWEYGEDNDGNPTYLDFGDPMPRGMTGNEEADPDNGQNAYDRMTFGVRYHLTQPLTLIYEFAMQDNLFGFPEPGANMYNPDWVAGMGRTVNVDSNWHMFMVMFAF